MRYSVVSFSYSFAEDWQQDLWNQQLGDLGFDMMDGTDAYIPTQVLALQRSALEDAVRATEGVTLVRITECPDADWNAAWEADHPIQNLPLDVTITPHCAFGAGHHETTAMLVDQFIRHPDAAKGKWVLDNGTGTGVLAIMAAKCGATHVMAVDIDEHSVANARENAMANGVSIEVQLASTPPTGPFDLIVSNIHRNILIDQMPLYARSLRCHGQVWISGFLTEDIPALTRAAQASGFDVTDTETRSGWVMMQLIR